MGALLEVKSGTVVLLKFEKHSHSFIPLACEQYPFIYDKYQNYTYSYIVH